MKIIHDRGYTEQELKDYKSVIQSNIFKSARALVEACSDLGISIEDSENQKRAQTIEEIDEEEALNIGNIWSQDLGLDIGALWTDVGIKKAYDRRNEFQLDDSTAYYMNNIDRISAPNYLPTQEDVLRSRLKTTGIVEVACKLGDKRIRLVDVGGQRNERRKVCHHVCIHFNPLFVVDQLFRRC